ncbi:MAG: cytochrome c maturation protein CcmE [Polyangia bacterium]
MRRRIIQIAISALLVGGGLIYLIASSFGDSMVYYKTVEEVLAERERFEGRPVRVNGLLVDGSVRRKPNSDEFRFDLSKNEKVLSISYSGILPDSMKPGRELVVQGVLQPGADLLMADEILTKCPSKYEDIARSKGEDP